MEGNCYKCTAPAKSYDFAVCNVHSTSSTSYSGRKQITTTVTNEGLDRLETASVCDSCIKKKRTGNAVGAGFGTWGGCAIFILILIAFCGKDYINDHFGSAALISLGIGLAVGIFMCAVEFSRKDAIIAAQIMTKALNEQGKVWVALDRTAYTDKNGTPSLQTFKERAHLKTNVGDMLFMLFVMPPNGHELFLQAKVKQEENKA